MLLFLPYALTFAAVLFSITSLPSMLFGGILVRVFQVPLLVGMFTGYILSWSLVNWLWKTGEGGSIPLLALFGALGIIFVHGRISRKTLTSESNTTMAAEVWAIIIVGGYLVAMAEPVRWV